MLFYILLFSLISYFNFLFSDTVFINTAILKPATNIEGLEGIQEFIEYPEEYEKPFLKGIPGDLAPNLIKQKNGNGPHCWEPFILPDPWHNINYRRMPYVAVLNNWYIDPSYNACGTIFNDKQKLHLWYQKYPVFGQVSYKTNKEVVYIDKAIHLLQRCIEGYYHFLLEALPRLLLVKDIINNDPSIKILFNSPYRNFMTEVLDLLEIDNSRVIYCDPEKIYHVDTLYFPKPPFMGYPSKEEIIRIRRRLLKAVKEYDDLDNGEAPIEKRDLIIVIERLETARHVKNTNELVEAIKSFFPSLKDKIVVFDGRLSVKDQIKLFKHAKFIIGPHGAGFTNMLFASPGTHNIEFLPENYLSILYWHVAYALDIDHNHILIPGASKNSQFFVPIKTIINMMKFQFAKDEIKNNDFVKKAIENSGFQINNFANDIDKKLDMYGNTLLIYAVNSGDINLVKNLVECGADPLKKNNYGYDSFYHANNLVGEKWQEISDLLIKLQARNNLKKITYLPKRKFIDGINEKIDVYGNTLFIHAIIQGDIDFAKELLEYGADPFKKNNYGYDALYHAQSRVMESNYKDVVIWLEDIHRISKEINSDENIVKVIKNNLIDLKAVLNNIDMKIDIYGNTLFILAVSYGNINLAKKLLDYGANPFKNNDFGCDALYHAMTHPEDPKYQEIINWINKL